MHIAFSGPPLWARVPAVSPPPSPPPATCAAALVGTTVLAQAPQRLAGAATRATAAVLMGVATAAAPALAEPSLLEQLGAQYKSGAEQVKEAKRRGRPASGRPARVARGRGGGGGTQATARVDTSHMTHDTTFLCPAGHVAVGWRIRKGNLRPRYSSPPSNLFHMRRPRKFLAVTF